MMRRILALVAAWLVLASSTPGFASTRLMLEATASKLTGLVFADPPVPAADPDGSLSGAVDVVAAAQGRSCDGHEVFLWRLGPSDQKRLEAIYGQAMAGLAANGYAMRRIDLSRPDAQAFVSEDSRRSLVAMWLLHEDSMGLLLCARTSADPPRLNLPQELPAAAQAAAPVEAPRTPPDAWVPSTQPRPHHFSGRVSARDGQPIRIPGAQVEVTITGHAADGYTYPAVRFQTGPDGRYDQQVPPGRYRVYAVIRFPWRDQMAQIHLTPLDPAPMDQQYDATKGVVRDFMFKPSGRRNKVAPSDRPNSYIGGKVDWSASTMKGHCCAPAKNGPLAYTLTFTPTSPLIDGLPGESFDRKVVAAKDTDSGTVTDIPPADYTVTAKVTAADGGVRPARFYDAKRGYVDSVKITSWRGLSAFEDVGYAVVEPTFSFGRLSLAIEE